MLNDNPMPNNLEAEQGLLSALLCNNAAYDRVFDVIREEHFYAPAHRAIFREIRNRIEAGQRALATTIHESIFEDDSLKQQGGASAYLADLLAFGAPIINARDYAEHIRDDYYKRQLMGAFLSANEELSNGGKLEDIVSRAEASIFAIRQNEGSEILCAAEGWSDTLHWIEAVRNGEIRPTKTGYSALDDLIQGLYPGRLYVLAARPGMGKTALGVNIAENVAAQGDVLFFSMEMPSSELQMRLAARHTGISVQKQAKGQLTDEEFRRLSLSRPPRSFHIYERAGVDINHIVMQARRFARQKNPALIVIDYLGLITGDNRMQKVHQIEVITTRLKTLAKELNIPIILLSQLSRALEQREDKRPMLSDLRDSGAIEQDADVVMFIYRPEYYADREEPKRKAGESFDAFNQRLNDFHSQADANRGKAQIIVAKNRQGVCDTAVLNFDGIRQYFHEGF